MDELLLILVSITLFSCIIMLLVTGLVLASKKLLPQGTVSLKINEESRVVSAQPGSSLLTALAENKIFLPSACGGGGTCALCKCRVLDGGGSLLPTEAGQISKAEAKEGFRLACQLKVKNDMSLDIPTSVLEIKKFTGTVRSNHNVATFIKELIIDLEPDAELDFRAGGYIQLDVPAYKNLAFRDFDIEAEYLDAWDKYHLRDLTVSNPEPCFRAYSMANAPGEGNIVMLNVRIATPPAGLKVQPGIASSYIFNLKPGDKVCLSGPYGEFFAKDTDREMIYIGGGAGMAPMRSHIFDLFINKKTTRKVGFWYGGRSVRELFYLEDFKRIKTEFPNFSFHIALSEPQPEDNWNGPTGFIHKVVNEQYLQNHPDPSEIEYYLCGPAPMIAAVDKMLYDQGVEKEMIDYDEFG